MTTFACRNIVLVLFRVNNAMHANYGVLIKSNLVSRKWGEKEKVDPKWINLYEPGEDDYEIQYVPYISKI